MCVIFYDIFSTLRNDYNAKVSLNGLKVLIMHLCTLFSAPSEFWLDNVHNVNNLSQ